MNAQRLKNRYFLMRHGRSLANEQGIIISHPQNGCPSYGLTETGRQQLRESLRTFRKEVPFISGDHILLYSSDFLRTLETAELVSSILKTAPPSPDPLLRERNFGDYEKMGDSHYRHVWEKDRLSNDNKDRGVESPEEVRLRFLGFLEKMEGQHRGKTIIIVSHGDILQIALTWPAGLDAKDHRSQKHMQTAEIRLFNAL